ncbi:MAG: 50S ribosomal protein L6 [Candidatus Margulisiibacteriota bacterium]|nr:ribosomal protein L6 [uncultured bacterium]OGH99638.1 MAG: 50S ribosomal protein L6 [Candidatus Margulisbacteria bacterium GWD2_39_127]OGI04629.1 MAG: 50S ribosomal protein L6 [Candidatus Margulisbacteria bacterium GWF2_38_17]OGI11839.1 MAG: 50S ribosomal protein L6 [Candidatus Margulisbacteria bacterium GWE2_39_32]PZM79786.1 MAG: 50S ribosomal protein L6 [Candidatus Margulisiibacteriota bacterium]
MSRIGRNPIEIKNGISISIENTIVTVKGEKGEMRLEVSPLIVVTQEDNKIIVSRTSDLKKVKALHGLYRALIANMVKGVSEGFEKALEINGVGYKVQKKGKGLLLSLGYSHQIDYPEQIGIEFVIENDTKFKIVGIDKAKVGQVAAEIRELRPPEPYKGKGIKYANEVIRRKAGKAGKK